MQSLAKERLNQYCKKPKYETKWQIKRLKKVVRNSDIYNKQATGRFKYCYFMEPKHATIREP